MQWLMQLGREGSGPRRPAGHGPWHGPNPLTRLSLNHQRGHGGHVREGRIRFGHISLEVAGAAFSNPRVTLLGVGVRQSQREVELEEIELSGQASATTTFWRVNQGSASNNTGAVFAPSEGGSGGGSSLLVGPPTTAAEMQEVLSPATYRCCRQRAQTG